MNGLVLIASILMAPAALPQAVEPASLASDQGVTVEALQARSAAVAADDRLDAAAREQAVTAYGKAIKLTEAARVSEAAARDFQLAATAAPVQAEEQRRLLAPEGDVGVAPLPTEDPSTSRVDLESALSSVQARAAALRSRDNELTEAVRTQESRSAVANAELADTRQLLLTLDNGPPDTRADPPAVIEARAAARNAQRRAYAARIHMLEQELAALPARQDLLRVQSSVVRAQSAVVEKQALELQARLQRRLEREADAERVAAERAMEALADQHPILVAQAEVNAELTRELSEMARQLSRSAEARTRAEGMRTQLAESQEAAREAMSIGTGGEEFSAMLRQIRSEVPPVPALESDIAQRRKALLDGRLARLRLRERLRLLGNLPVAVDRLSRESGVTVLPQEAAATLEGLLVKRRDLIQQTIQSYDHLITRYEELNSIQQELQTGAAELDEALNERLLWLPSAPRLTSSLGNELWTGLSWLAAPPDGWGAVGSRLVTRAVSTAPIGALILLALLGAVVTRRRMRSRLSAIADRIGRVGSDAHHLTPQAIGISMMLVAPAVLIPVYLGGLIGGDDAPMFARALGHALIGAGVLMVILRTFSTMCCDDGVFDAHFGWSDRARRVLGSNLRWLILLLVPVAIVVVMTDLGGADVLRNGLGRLAFIFASLGLSLFIFRALHPERGAFAEFMSPSGVVWRTRTIWFWLLVSAPLALGTLAGYGYYDTAAMIQERMFSTGWISLLGLVGYSVIMRWVVVAHRRMALQQAREKRDSARAAQAQKSAAEASGEAMPELELPKIDLSSVNQQTRTLIRAAVGLATGFALWLVWSRMFPALSVLDELPAWHRMVVTENGTEKVAVSWGAVLGAALVGAATLLAYFNLPGLLEIVLFQRGGIERGTRYAITTISRYLIVMLGVLFALNLIGWDWSKAQWIVAALGVGLGFGLQEIVANFVSGLILLFERPVRVGDTVSVGDLSGTVSRLQIRATTITDWDNREIIVPNKDLITGRVVNWTLTSSVTRIVLNVGVAYGTDTVRAQQVMLDTARAFEHVLATPAPTVFFLGFGDSSLNFELRVFVGDLGHRLPVLHELHTAINIAFAEAGIEIPFPQRDIHMRTVPPQSPQSPE